MLHFNEYTLISQSIKICIHTTGDIISEIEKLVPAIIPNGILLTNTEKNDQGYTYSLFLSPSITNNFQFDESWAIIEGSYSHKDLAFEALLFLSRIIEREYNLKGIFSLNSCTFCDNEDAIILAGKNHVGKTTIGLFCCLSNPSLQILTGDRTLVDSYGLIRGGVKSAAIRKGSIIYELPQLRNYFPDFKVNNEPWDEFVFLHHNKYITFSTISSAKIKAFFFPKKADSALNIQTIKYPKSLWMLHDALAFYSDSFPSILPNQIKPVPFYNTYDIRVDRLKCAQNLTSRIPCYSISGTLKDISEYLLKYIESIKIE